MSKTQTTTDPTTDPTPAETTKQVKVQLSYTGIADGEVFFRGTLNGEAQATEFNQLIALTNQPQEFTLEGQESKINALIQKYEDDTRINIKIL